MLLYPGDALPEVRTQFGFGLMTSEVRLGCHIGTHVDAPSHFLAGTASVEQLPLAAFFGPALVLHVADAAALQTDCRRHILLRTGEPIHAGLTVGAIARVLAHDPLSIGCDAYSLERAEVPGFPVHKAVANQGLPAFVRLDLSGVEPGEYLFCALPWKLAGVEGIPVRAVLLTDR
jgi:arylformamidase